MSHIALARFSAVLTASVATTLATSLAFPEKALAVPGWTAGTVRHDRRRLHDGSGRVLWRGKHHQFGWADPCRGGLL